MKPLFHPKLVNDPFEDPGVFVDCLFERRAILFDLGDLRRLATRKILKLTDVFVSHTHMDHFVGFDWLLRVSLGREKTIRLYGPPGFLAQVEHRLLAYTWNLVGGYDVDLVFEVTEIWPGGRGQRAIFRCRSAFRREREETVTLASAVLRDEDGFVVRGVFLDHKIPCLAFALEEKEHLNVWKNRLDEMGLPTGAWLQELKRAVRRGEPDDYPVRVWWKERGRELDRFLPLAELRGRILEMVPGQKIAYVTDAVYHEANARDIVALARGADILFIETPFLERDAGRAAQRFHLTAHQAGTLARAAGAKTVVPFHFSPMYEDDGEALRAELYRAFGAGPPQAAAAQPLG
jgi:ribonuclease Z